MMTFPLWRWIKSLLNRRHREMLEQDLWPPEELLFARPRRQRAEAFAQHQASLLELGKELGIYPARTINGPHGPVIPAAAEELADRRALWKSLAEAKQ